MLRSHVGQIGTLTVLALGVAACSTAAPSTPSPTTTPPAATTTAPALPTQLGPDGFGALKLGMTKAEARATGLTIQLSSSPEGACGGPGDGYLAGSPSPSADTDVAGRLFFSQRTNRLVAIYAYPGVKTPEGVGLGSSYDEVHAAFPTWAPLGPDPRHGRGGVATPGNPGAGYRIVIGESGGVVQLSLDGDQDCYE